VPNREALSEIEASSRQFLLDAVLGYITIEQDYRFKILTIVSAVGIAPPYWQESGA
jgi:hypothetical protein